MVALSYYQEINLKYTTFLKTFIFIFIIWNYSTYNAMDIFPKSLENKYEHTKILNRNLHRLLAKHELHKKLGYTVSGAQMLHDSIGKSKKNVTDNTSISSQLKKKGSNNFDTYMKNYKSRYEKKKGLSKLDCYCEKSVFDKINYIEKLSEKMRSDKKVFKKKILKKYGIGSIIFTLIPAIGLIYYILFGLGGRLGGEIELCMDGRHYVSGTTHPSSCSAGKGKMNRKEYICFCKEIFNIN
ncbi:variable surface protein Vir11, putative [Plasmodium vivax]|uniref:Variable surface protein Vir11, putative n=1 Tax=Plasmodium vivax (strain Salvador I) TaxID=126793 RepID=A5KDB6_PLAVS|nr:variable surface protein Vir11, putative [Plasmodium vivax]EDL42653.1 variable surface protein Vir11, putative [Plasmodium vivax]|eukprot:XP_001612446.1 variable surface protein Vir11 [Plasmodium vivax Sal-1]